MEDKYACMRCKCSGAKSLVPYKIIRDDNGESVKFVGQLCERGAINGKEERWVKISYTERMR